MLPKEDLELIDALVWAGCISRSVAREVAVQAQPGKVATCITERGLAPLIAPPQVIIRALATAEAIAEEWAVMRGLVAPPRTGTHLDCAEMHDVCPYDRRVHGQCSCGGSRNAYLSCEVHAPQPETD
jgi:hypothetical protein